MDFSLWHGEAVHGHSWLEPEAWAAPAEAPHAASSFLSAGGPQAEVIWPVPHAHVSDAAGSGAQAEAWPVPAPHAPHPASSFLSLGGIAGAVADAASSVASAAKSAQPSKKLYT